MSTKQTTPRRKRKGETTKSKLTAIAMDLFQRKGFVAVGLNELCQAGDLPKGSIYYHFPKGKNDIAIAVVNRAKNEIGKAILQAGAAADSKEAFIAALVQGFAQSLIQSEFEKGCPVSTLALELSAQEAEIAAAISDCYAYWQGLVAERLVRFGEQPEVAAQLAQFSFCALEGALILARTQKSLHPLEQVQQHLIQHLSFGVKDA
ncbi:TetR/AcrR family transcriptional regulator [Maritalea mediterranea]|uniref:TetR/AcrR family transcriptional regulator n=1 Tax=Maritalea mediterranea TaxID=2909667 RepID=A0ABS9E8E2_9HYPH|nr:TetR/AcrR family transcriptional regulator [Maritalea mediterranea]MCF4097726.1 TetR/AcrR family transcriptional regulator [Maritalea mediterranea]